jgi:hypothetical protein
LKLATQRYHNVLGNPVMEAGSRKYSPRESSLSDAKARTLSTR